jgi:hypothetical protein
MIRLDAFTVAKRSLLLPKLSTALPSGSGGTSSYDELYRHIRFDDCDFVSPAEVYPWTAVTFSYAEVLLAWAVFAIEASCLARNGRDRHRLIEFCVLVGRIIIDEDGCYAWFNIQHPESNPALAACANHCVRRPHLDALTQPFTAIVFPTGRGPSDPARPSDRTFVEATGARGVVRRILADHVRRGSIRERANAGRQ